MARRWLENHGHRNAASRANSCCAVRRLITPDNIRVHHVGGWSARIPS